MELLAIGWAEEHENWQNTMDQRKIFEWILDREEARWRQILERYMTSGADIDELYDLWKDIICYCAVSGGIDVTDLERLPDDLRAIVKKLFRIVGGTRHDRIYHQNICRFLEEMLGSEDEEVTEIKIEWPDIIIEFMFLRFINRDKDNLNQFADVYMEINKKSAISFLNKINDDFPYDKLASKLLVLNPPLLRYTDDMSDNFHGFSPKPLSKKKEKYYFEQLANGHMEARNIIVEHSMYLVARVVKKYFNQTEEDVELLSVGTIALIKAATSFSYQEGVSFATYASHAIEDEILRFMRSNMKWPKEVPLFDPIGVNKEGEPVTLFDVFDRDEDEILDAIFLEQQKESVIQAMKEKLSDREKTIINMRYGLDDNDPMSQREIALKLGLSRSYVSRIEKKAIEKLRVEFEKRG